MDLLNKIKKSVVVITCLLAANLTAQENENLDGYILSEMDKLDVPGLSVAIINNGQISTRPYGVRSVDSDELVDDKTIFEAASLSKPVFALVVLELAKRNVIDLDRPVHEYIEQPSPFGPDFFSDESYKMITPRMVLSHTSGLPNGTSTPGKIHFNPGARFAYSGTGFRYLLEAVENVTDRALPQLLDELVFGPLDMPDSSFIWRDSFAQNVAWGHNADGEMDREILHLQRAFPEGGLITNARDYAKFVAYLLEEHRNGNQLVLDMASPTAVALDFAEAGKFSWGLGWGVEEAELGSRLWHTGSNGVFKSFVILDLEGNSALLFFANAENGLELISGLLRITIGGSTVSHLYQETISNSMAR